MSLSKSFADPGTLLVADASVVINLNATGRARDIVKAIPYRIVVSSNTVAELELGERNGHEDARQLQALIDQGLVGRIELGAKGIGLYGSLIDGAALTTLDDGEAATIACALEQSAVAVIDERKARSLCAIRFSDLRLGCTAQLLTHATVAAALNADHVMTIVRALQVGRMRVPYEYVGDIVTLIGSELAASCMSLPKSARMTA